MGAPGKWFGNSLGWDYLLLNKYKVFHMVIKSKGQDFNVTCFPEIWWNSFYIM